MYMGLFSNGNRCWIWREQERPRTTSTAGSFSLYFLFRLKLLSCQRTAQHLDARATPCVVVAIGEGDTHSFFLPAALRG